jgi:hypothetical protein
MNMMPTAGKTAQRASLAGRRMSTLQISASRFCFRVVIFVVVLLRHNIHDYITLSHSRYEG